MKKRLMIIGSLIEFVELIKLAKKRGYYTIVCDGYKDGPGKKYADKSYDVDIRNVNEIAEICKKEKIDGIIGSFSDIIFEQITQIADKANLKWYVKPKKLKYYREKDEAKKILNEMNIKTAKFVTLRKEFKDEELSAFHFPVIVKPVNGWGSKGIYVCKNIDEIRKKIDNVTFRYNEQEIFIEEYIDFHEYNMQTWLKNGKVYVLGIADRDRNEQEGDEIKVLNRVLYPAFNIKKVYNKASEILQKFADYTGQKDGALSMQFFYDDINDEIIVCEIAGRFLGYEHELIKKCGGIDIEELLLDYAFDEEALNNKLENNNPFFEKYSAGLYFHGKDKMEIANMDSVYEIENLKHVDEMLLFYNVGEKIDNNSSKSYFARYYISADSREEIDEVTKKAFDLMNVTTKEGKSVVYKNELEYKYKNLK